MNISDILKDCPKGMKLYSPLWGECEFDSIDPNSLIIIKYNNAIYKFYKNGAKWETGECLLFPSKELRDWNKFKAPKKEPKFKIGDIVKQGINMIPITNNQDSRYTCITPEVANKNEQVYKLATPEEIVKWNNEKLHPIHLHYSKTERKIIYWFLPFDKVIGRNATNKSWSIDFFQNYIKNTESHYGCMVSQFKECYPFNNDTVKLIGTTNDYEVKK